MVTTTPIQMQTVTSVAEILSEQGLTLATAESCTGGLIAAHCTDLAGSSHWFTGGIVSYSNAMKTKLLGVSTSTLAAHGAVSAQTAEQMARGAIACSGANISIATTGIAGPGGGSADKPVGTVWLASIVGGKVESVCQYFPGDREAVRVATVNFAFSWLLKRLKSIS